MEKIFLRQMTLQFFILYLVLLVFLLISGNLTGAYGLTFGTLMAVLNFHLLAATLRKSLTLEPQKARFYASIHYFLRYMLFLFVLLVALKRADMNFLWAVIGLLIPKAVIFGGNFYDLFKHRRSSGGIING